MENSCAGPGEGACWAEGKVRSGASQNAHHLRGSSMRCSAQQQPIGEAQAKKKAAANHQDLPHADLETVLEGLHARPEFASLPTSNSFFSSVSAFQQLTSALWSSEVAVTAAQRSIVLSSTKRALTCLATVLHSILCSQNITVASQVLTLQTLASILHHVVSSSVPLLLRKPKRSTNQPGTVSSLLNKLLDALITSIFSPVVESFLPLSRRYLASLFSTNHQQYSPPTSVSSAYEVDLRVTIALIALRGLENLFPSQRTDGTRLPRTRDNRLDTLARKDTLWYLCTVLHDMFAPPKESSQSVSNAGAVSERKITHATFQTETLMSRDVPTISTWTLWM
ncbi:hypothetical protein B0H14DRAFT_3895748, partial [Mycena olivaceomarginata]